jgi:hypothetical protein
MSEISILAMLMLSFSGFGFAAFSVAERVGRMTGALWWEEKLLQNRG